MAWSHKFVELFVWTCDDMNLIANTSNMHPKLHDENLLDLNELAETEKKLKISHKQFLFNLGFAKTHSSQCAYEQKRIRGRR